MNKQILLAISTIAAIISVGFPHANALVTQNVTTIYTIPYNHDGWNLLSNHVGPWNGTGYSPINGTDLTAITNSSIVIAQLHNSEMYAPSLSNSANYAMCNVWDTFTHGFHVYCNTDNYVPQKQPELRVLVINP